MLCDWRLLLHSAAPFPKGPTCPGVHTSFKFPLSLLHFLLPLIPGRCLYCSQFVKNTLASPKGPSSVLPSLWNCRPISAWRPELLSLDESRDNNRTSVHVHFFLGRGYIGFIKFSKCPPPPCPLHSSQLMFSECFPHAWHCWKSFAWVVACHYWGGLLRWGVSVAPSFVCWELG